MNINPISFGRKYIGETAVRNLETGKKEPCRFFQYEYTPEDLADLYATLDSWKKEKGASNFIRYIKMERVQSFDDPNLVIYGLETKKDGEVVAIADTYESKMMDTKLNMPCQLDISYFVTKPQHVYGSKNRKFCKSGMALYGEVVKVAKKKRFKEIYLVNSNDEFWSKMPGVRKTATNDVQIPYENYDRCIKGVDIII